MAGEIATAYVQVLPSMDGVAAEVRKKFEDSGDRSGESFGSSFAKKAMAAVSAAAVGKVLKESLFAGGALQQSLGGVETLFKDSANKVIANAEQAYKTAGLSANGYMEQVTGFSASLLQSLGGDTVRAADMADMAMRDMSDNANKMGTNMESITNAYQGFAKGNFTMLDNLKLGYGGTKTEMERLLETANELNAQQGIYTDYQISSFADIAEAIHVVQDELGITGTTAKEASDTFTGSLSAMKASTENVLANLALGRKIQPSLNALSKTVSTFLVGNFAPMVINLFSSIPSAILSLTSGTFHQIEQDLNEKIPGLGDAFHTLETAILAAGAAYAGLKSGPAIMAGIKQAVGEVAGAVEIWSYQIGKAEMAQLALSGEMTVGQAVLSVLTGKMSIATLADAGLTAAQNALNAAMSANPIGLVIAAVAALGVAIGKNRQKVNELAKSFEIQAETAADAQAHLEELTAKLETYERNPNKRTAQERQEYEALTRAIADTEQQITELQQAEAEAAAAAAEAAADPVNIFNAATEQYVADATALYESFVQTYEGIFDQVSGWFGPFEEAATTVETSVDKMLAAMQSQMDFNQAYRENLSQLKEYGLGELSSIFQECGEDGAAYAAAIVKAVEEAGGASTEGGQEIIDGFKEMNAGVTESQEELSATLTTLDGEFETAMEGITSSYEEAIAGLDKSEEAKQAAITTFRDFKSGIESEKPGIMELLTNFGKEMTSALQSGIGTVTIPVKTTSVGINGSHAGGLDFVPFDNYIAALHKGEMVLTSYEADLYRKGHEEKSVKHISLVQNIYSEAKTAADLMQEAKYQAEMAVLLGV